MIKVCGLTDNESSRLVAEINGVNHLGFIFYEGSQRFTTTSFDTNKKKVGVFVNASADYIIKNRLRSINWM